MPVNFYKIFRMGWQIFFNGQLGRSQIVPLPNLRQTENNNVRILEDGQQRETE